jgi:hypothetical protein
MLTKFAVALIAATMLTAPALAQSTTPTPAAPATQSNKPSAVKTVNVSKHKHVKKAGIHRHARHVKHVRHARHGRHHVKHVAVKHLHSSPSTTGQAMRSAPKTGTN